ncbi:MAG: hypothetical protein AB1758_24465 [Candidatus Eremiobacterota bacterium]
MRSWVTLCLCLALLGWAAAEPWPADWSSVLGQRITLEGTTANAKLGAILVEGDRSVWIDGLEEWPEGKRVKVTGTVVGRDDLPVAQDHPVSAGVQGSPRRYLLSDPEWEEVR